MTFLEASDKLYNFYFKDSRKENEVLLFIDDQILIELFGDYGVELFLGLFTNIEKQFSYENKDPFESKKAIEKLSECFLMKKTLNILGKTNVGIAKVTRKSDHLDYNKCILVLILLLIYAENTDSGIFNSSAEKKIVGNEQIVRKNVSELLKVFSNHTIKNSEKGIVKFINLYGNNIEQYKYVGFFKYHTPLNKTLYKTVLNIKYKNGFHYEIKDTNIIENVFKEVLDDNRFKNNREVGYIIINKVINGTYKIDLKPTNTSNNSDNRITSNIDDVFILPSIFISNTGEITKLLRIHCQGGPSQLHLNIDGVEHIVDRFSGLRYKVIELRNWPDKIDVINYEVNYPNPENTFFVPIKLNDVWNNVSRNEYITSPFSYSNYVCYYISNDLKRIKALEQCCPNTIWEKVGSNGLYATLKCSSNIYIKNKGFKSTIQNTNYSVINIIDNNFYIKRHTSKWSYPYYFLPSITINKQQNEKCFYKLNSNSEVEINDDTLDLNKISNIEPGTISLYIKNEKNEKNESTEKTINLLNEPDQKVISDKNCQLTDIKSPSSFHSWKDIKMDEFEDSFLARMLYTLTSNSDIVLNDKFIYKAIDGILLKFNSRGLIENYAEKKFIIRDLIALGYIYKSGDLYKVRDLALVQTNFKPLDEYKFIFRLSGSRNFNFVKTLIEDALKNDVVVKRLERNNSDAQSLLMPSEIYFLFKDSEHLKKYLSEKINARGISDFVKIVPFIERVFDNLSIIGDRNIYEFISDQEPICLNSLNVDSKIYKTIIPGKFDLISEINGRTSYLRSVIATFGEKYFKIKNSELAIVNSLSKNNIPFIFSQNHGGKEVEYGNIFIPCNYPYIIPQEFYTNLVYINGGLPRKISISRNTGLINDNKENIGVLADFILVNSSSENIEFYCFINIPTHNKVKKAFVESLKTKMYYLNFNPDEKHRTF